jgi:hypothetical protein
MPTYDVLVYHDFYSDGVPEVGKPFPASRRNCRSSR